MSLIHQIRHWLTGLDVPEDGRLPPERHLTELFGTSRSELRKALAVLEREGRLSRQVGRGTYLIPEKSVTPAFIRNVADVTSPVEAMQARLLVEPEIACLAAVNANSSQIKEMVTLTAQMRLAGTWQEYEDLDWRFHNAIAAASGNRLLIEVQNLVNGVRKLVVWGRLHKTGDRPPSTYHSFKEHDDIVAAITDRDRLAAGNAMRRHLESTAAALAELPKVAEMGAESR